MGSRKKSRPRKRRSVKVARSRIAQQLEQLHKKLRRSHPNLVGIGIGLRRKNGRVLRRGRELVVRLIVKPGTKPRSHDERLPKGIKRLPDHVDLVRHVLGEQVKLRLRTDIEEPPAVSLMQFRTFWSEDSSTATALARLTDDKGNRRIGMLCCAHAAPEKGKRVGIDGQRKKIGGKVVARTDFYSDGLDIALVMLDANAKVEDLQDAGPVTLPTLSRTDLIDLLGERVDDGKDLGAKFWRASAGVNARASAYFDELKVTINGKLVVLRQMIEFDATGTPYQPGVSGSTLGVQGRDGSESPIALASVAADGGQRCFAMHLGAAVDWLRENGFSDLTPVWPARELN